MYNWQYILNQIFEGKYRDFIFCLKCPNSTSTSPPAAVGVVGFFMCWARNQL